MEEQQRGAKSGCSGTVDNLLIYYMVTKDCQRNKGNLSMASVDVKKAHDSVDHGWLVEMMHMPKFPRWLCKAIHNLCMCWNTRIVAKTTKGFEKSSSIRFNRGLPQGNSHCPRLFTLCINPVAWKLKATVG